MYNLVVSVKPEALLDLTQHLISCSFSSPLKKPLPTASAHLLLERAAAADLVLEAKAGNKILYQSQAVRSNSGLKEED